MRPLLIACFLLTPLLVLLSDLAFDSPHEGWSDPARGTNQVTALGLDSAALR
jgi:hypothetical protein